MLIPQQLFSPKKYYNKIKYQISTSKKMQTSTHPQQIPSPIPPYPHPLHTLLQSTPKPYLFNKFLHNNQPTYVIITQHTLYYYMMTNVEMGCGRLCELELEFVGGFWVEVWGDGWGFGLDCYGELVFYGDGEIGDWGHWLAKVIRKQDVNQLYRRVCKLGSGGAANVYLIQRIKDNRQFAAKVFSRQKIESSQTQSQKLHLQIQTLQKFSHQNIQKFHGVHKSPKTIYLLTEYIRGHNLSTFLSLNYPLPSHLRKKIMKGLLSAVAQMEFLRILHRDIKPENIMVGEQGEVKVVDFGIATQVDLEEYLLGRCGTPGYVAPEIIGIGRKDGKDGKEGKSRERVRLTTKSDVFSVGAVFYEVLFGVRLFGGNIKESFQRCLNYDGSVPNIEAFSSLEQYNLLQRMLDLNPETRISASQALKSPYFTQNQTLQLNTTKFPSQKQLPIF